MTETILYVLEWDSWHFLGVFRSKKKAKSNKTHYLVTIRRIIVIGTIYDNKVFIVTDGQGDWVKAIYTTEQEANERLDAIPFEHKFRVKEVIVY